MPSISQKQVEVEPKSPKAGRKYKHVRKLSKRIDEKYGVSKHKSMFSEAVNAATTAFQKGHTRAAHAWEDKTAEFLRYNNKQIVPESQNQNGLEHDTLPVAAQPQEASTSLPSNWFPSSESLAHQEYYRRGLQRESFRSPDVSPIGNAESSESPVRSLRFQLSTCKH